jgi:hypothetical protein
MRKAVVVRVTVLTALVGSVSASFASGPAPVVINDNGMVPFTGGADAMIRAANSSTYVGTGVRGKGQVIDQNIRQYGTAVSYVRGCNAGIRGPLRFRGPGSTLNWVVRYRIGSRDITRAVISKGGFGTGFLKKSECRRIQVRVHLVEFGDSYGHSVRVEVIPSSGVSDAVSTRVHVIGTLVVP